MALRLSPVPTVPAVQVDAPEANVSDGYYVFKDSDGKRVVLEQCWLANYCGQTVNVRINVGDGTAGGGDASGEVWDFQVANNTRVDCACPYGGSGRPVLIKTVSIWFPASSTVANFKLCGIYAGAKV